MTNRKAGRVASASTPAPISESTPEPIVESVKAGRVESVNEEVAALADTTVAEQKWLLTIPVTESYTIGLTVPDTNNSSTMFLFDSFGGKIVIGVISISPMATETDVLKAVKRLSGQIISGISRNLMLM